MWLYALFPSLLALSKNASAQDTAILLRNHKFFVDMLLLGSDWMEVLLFTFMANKDLKV